MSRFFYRNPMTLFLIAYMAFRAMTDGRYSSPMDWLMSTLVFIPGIVIGLSFHEFAHAYVAYKCGDDTPKLQNRVTLNPGAHIDPVGLIALVFIGFGWGRPVMINPLNFKNRRRDEFLVAIAGVTLNFVLAFLFLLILKILYGVALEFMLSPMGGILHEIILNAVFINIVLMVFNLLPVPPLDGFNIITQVFNLKYTDFYYRIYDKGFLILMFLIVFNITGMVLSPMVSKIFGMMVGILF